MAAYNPIALQSLRAHAHPGIARCVSGTLWNVTGSFNGVTNNVKNTKSMPATSNSDRPTSRLPGTVQRAGLARKQGVPLRRQMEAAAATAAGKDAGKTALSTALPKKAPKPEHLLISYDLQHKEVRFRSEGAMKSYRPYLQDCA
jgi:hypothetical protein